MRRYLFLMLPLLLLAACAPPRNAADSKLAVACEASVKAVFKDPKENISIKHASYASQKAYDGVKLRVVTLEAAYTYGTGEPETKTYICSYTEEWTPFSWLPEFYSLQMGEEKFGNINGSVLGETDVLLKITEANHKALH